MGQDRALKPPQPPAPLTHTDTSGWWGGEPQAYLESEQPVQALKDARTSLAWSKTRVSPAGWARAHWLMSLALERVAHLVDFSKTEIAALGEGGRKYALHVPTTTAAVLCVRRAFEADPAQEEFVTELKRLVRKLDDGPRKVLLTEGADGT